MSLTNLDLAQTLFPDITETIEDIIAQYPPRPNEQVVMRMAPSPT